MNSWCTLVTGCALYMATAVPAQAQAPAVRVNVTGRIQVQWNSTSVDEAEAGMTTPIAASTFETRRVRLGADVQVADWIRGRIEPELAMGRLQLRQAWVSMEFDPALVVRAGQFKKPFSTIFLTSSARHAVIERGARIRGLDQALVEAAAADDTYKSVRGQVLIGEQHTLLDTQLYLGYELGAAVEGRYAGLGWSIGVFNGTGPDMRDENDGLSAAGGVTYELSAAQPLRLGAAWSRRELNWPAPTSMDTRSGNAFEVDLEYGGFRHGVWLIAEASTGTNLATRERFAGAQVVGSYFSATSGPRVEGVEPMMRVSWGDPDRTVSGDAGVLVTPGVNLYFFGQNRLMFNWDVYLPEGGRDVQHAGRAQANLFF
jgi:hypothetical protein